MAVAVRDCFDMLNILDPTCQLDSVPDGLDSVKFFGVGGSCSAAGLGKVVASSPAPILSPTGALRAWCGSRTRPAGGPGLRGPTAASVTVTIQRPRDSGWLGRRLVTARWYQHFTTALAAVPRLWKVVTDSVCYTGPGPGPAPDCHCQDFLSHVPLKLK